MRLLSLLAVLVAGPAPSDKSTNTSGSLAKTDEDRDGYFAGTDSNDADASTHPSARIAAME